ncbi:uncharacterized protein [Fopius arisanus]|uniref:Uncharacterized protein n=1 Tax=Fopius arisanus TaxID=64838 RepID=A0A0C9QRL7_9HYME|nr:PREDICTED: uncharacterized protein LOC105272421 [Fopius arisanus]
MICRRILHAILAVGLVEASSGAAIHQVGSSSEKPPISPPPGRSSPLLNGLSTLRPELVQTRTLSDTDKTVLSSGVSEILSQIDRTSTLRASPSVNEVIDEVDHTYAIKQPDERLVTQVNMVHDYAQGRENGVDDVFVKDDTNRVIAMDNSRGEKKMVSSGKSNAVEAISQPGGVEQTFRVSQEDDFQQIEDHNGLEVTGNTRTDRIYLEENSDEVTSFYSLNTTDNRQMHNLVRNGNNIEEDTSKSNATGLSYTDEGAAVFSVDGTEKNLRVSNKGVQALIGVDKSKGVYNSVDNNGNKDLILIDETAHNIDVEDGVIGMSLNTNDMNNVFGFKDEDGTVGAYEENGTDHSLTITDGSLSANVDLNNVDELFGISTPDGVADVHQISQAGELIIVDDGERGVALGAKKITEAQGLFDNGDLITSFQGNQIDRALSIAEGSFDGTLQTSQTNGVYQMTRDDGQVEVMETEEQMIDQTIVIDDDRGTHEAREADELVWETSAERPDETNYQQSERSPVINGFSTSRPEPSPSSPDISVIRGISKIQSESRRGDYRGTEAPRSTYNAFRDLVTRFDQLYQAGDIEKIGNIFGGRKKNKIDVQITINMEI